MATNGKNQGSKFLRATGGLPRSMTIIGSSLNIQRNVEVTEVLPPELQDPYDRDDGKLVVARIFCPVSDWGVYEVTLLDGATVSFRARRTAQFTSGSAGNVALVLKQLGVGTVGVIGAVGTGDQGNGFSKDLMSQGLEYGLFPGEHTNFTLAVQKRGSGRTLLLCEKHPWKNDLPAGAIDHLVRQLGSATPAAIILTGVRSAEELALSERLVEEFGRRQTLIAFSPHRDLIGNTELRIRLLDLLREVSLLQVNRKEAALLVGAPQSADPLAMIKHLAALGPERAVITLAGEGSIAAEVAHGRVQVCRQVGYRTNLVDDAGAGDVHLATLVYYLRLCQPRGIPCVKALAMAAYVAAKKVAHQGPFNGIPSPARQRQYLRGLKNGGQRNH